MFAEKLLLYRAHDLLQHGEIDNCIALLLHGRDLNDIIYTGNYAWTLTKDPELKGRPKL